MLTHLEVDGFKNLLGFSADFGPFTCIAGPNAIGKSNVFDAIQFLALLADHPVTEAASAVRATRTGAVDPSQLFWGAGQGEQGQARLLVEMETASEVEDDLGDVAANPHTHLRYEVVVSLLRRELVVEAETLIAFEPPYREGSGRVLEHSERPAKRTVVGTTTRADRPEWLAARREMQGWRVLNLDTEVLRRPDNAFGPAHLSNRGGHLAATLYRLKGDDPDAYAATAASLSALADVRRIEVDYDDKRETLTLFAAVGDGPLLPARNLSDGTLRFLALCVLIHDPEATGVYGIEEPENGIHPTKIGAMDQLLHAIAFDPSFPPGKDNPQRQVIVNTHSPALVREQSADDLLLAVPVKVRRGEATASTMRLVPLQGSWRAERRDAVGLSLGPADLTGYLDGAFEAPVEADLRRRRDGKGAAG